MTQAFQFGLLVRTKTGFQLGPQPAAPAKLPAPTAPPPPPAPGNTNNNTPLPPIKPLSLTGPAPQPQQITSNPSGLPKPAPAPTPPPAPAPVSAPQTLSVAAPQATVPTTESPATPVNTSPQPALVTTSVNPPPRPAFDNFEQRLKSAPPEQQAQVAQEDVKRHMETVPPATQKGVQDLQAGHDTAEARDFQAQVDQNGQKAMQEDVARQTQANPELAQTAQGFGQMWNNATNMWSSMPQEAKWMVGLGMPIAAVGLLSSMFGQGGGGMGLLGLLGLGAAGIGAAHSGALGDDARRMVGQGAVNLAGFFGQEIPTADKIRGALDPNSPSAGEGANKVRAAMNAQGENGSVGGWAAGQEALNKERAGLNQLMGMDRNMATTMLMGLQGEGAPQTADEANALYDQLAQKHQELSHPDYLRNKVNETVLAELENADTKNNKALSAMFDARRNRGAVNDAMNAVREQEILKAMQNDPNLARYLKKGPDGKLRLPAGNDPAAFGANMIFNAYGLPDDLQKEGAHRMDINKLIEKWAFNDVDAKELSDLKAEQAKGAPYRVEAARRENELQMRQKAEAPQKEVVIAACQKAARCWSGYEPVPGAKKFSKGSCRPKGSKKTQKEMKKS